MVEKSEKSEKGESADRFGGAKSKGIKCVAGICFNPSTGKLEIELNRDSCPPDVIKRIVEETVRGVDVELLIPKPKPKSVET